MAPPTRIARGTVPTPGRGRSIIGAEVDRGASDLRRQWLLANFAAFAVGGAVAGGALRALEEPYYGVMTSSIQAAYIQAESLGVAAAMFGALLGVAQWLVLRRTVRARWWALGTCLGWGLGGVVMGFNAGGSVSTIGPDSGPVHPLLWLLVGLPLVVLFLGVVQWLILRREFRGAKWWLLVNIGGLFVAFAVGFIVARMVPWLAPTDFPSAGALGLVGAVAGPVYGAITWAYLAELRRRELPSRNAPPTLS